MLPLTFPTWLPAILLLSTALATNPSPLIPRQASLLTCNQDNQLRALERFSTQATTFCPTYLAPTNTPAALPTYVADFQPADLSSACACFQASATNTAVVLTLSATRAPTTTASASASAAPKAVSTPAPAAHGGLSVRAKAGIGVACAVVGVGLVVGGAMLFRRKRGIGGPVGVLRSGRLEREGGAGPPAYDAVEKDAGGYSHEVEAGNRFELQGGKIGGKD